MSSRRGGSIGKGVGTVSGEASSKGKSVGEVTEPVVNQLTHGMSDMGLDPAQDDDGWEVARKHKNRSSSGAGKSWGSQNPNPMAWGHSNAQRPPFRNNGGGSGRGPANPLAAPAARPAGRGNGRFQPSNNSFQPAVIPPPLEQGWAWRGRSPLTQSAHAGPVKQENMSGGPPPFNANNDTVADVEDDDEEQSDDPDDSDDEYDSDESQKSHETRKKSKWFKEFFEILDSLTLEEINEPARQWHCAACQNGPGAIDWYRGLQPLMTHAKTKGSTRVKLHRELAELLDEELRRRGTSVFPAGEAFGKWRGLSQKAVKDKEIVWPPMVIVMNTQLEKDDNDMWVGMGNSELLEYFHSYAAVKARHSYGPQGHRGMSILIFEATAVGYLEAERLSKHFEDQGTDREGWDRRRVPFYPGGQRQLYGYMADKGDLDIFNKHAQGKSKLKYEMRSYEEMVVSQMKQMSEDNQQLIWLKNKVAKEKKHSKALEESFGFVSEKLRKTLEENRIVRQRTKTHHEQNKEEMDYQEEFFKEQIKLIHEARNEKEEYFEKLQQEKRGKLKQSLENPSSTEDHQRRVEKLATFIKDQNKEMDDFVEERDKMLKDHEEKMAEMKRRHHEEEVKLEKDFDAELTHLMQKYTPPQGSTI